MGVPNAMADKPESVNKAYVNPMAKKKGTTVQKTTSQCP